MRELLKDDRLHIGMALVQRVIVADDMTAVAVECRLIPEDRDIVVTETWESVGDDSVSGDIPDPGDLLIIVMADGDPDHAFSIRRLASNDEKLPKQIKDGHHVVKAKTGKKLYLGAEKVLIGKGTFGADCTENLVLGQVLKQFLKDEIDQLKKLAQDLSDTTDRIGDVITQVSTAITAVVTGPVGIIGAPTPGSDVPTNPVLISALTPVPLQLTLIKSMLTLIGSDASGVKSALDTLKSSPVADGAILSDTVFTEK